MSKQLYRTEIIAGLTNFFATAYIIAVNPSILSTDGTGMPFSGTMTATVLVCIVLTLMMGFYARLPYVVAPGMGVNAYFAYSVVIANQVPWQSALGIVFWAGILFILISTTPIRVEIARSIPPNIRDATIAGIGAMLAFIGFRNCGLITSDPQTFLKVGTLGFEAGMTLLGIVVIIALLNRHNPLSFLAGIAVVTVVSLIVGRVEAPATILSPPDFSSVFLKLDPFGALSIQNIPIIFGICITDLFDSIPTLMGVAMVGGMLDEMGEPLRLKEGLIVDAFATTAAGLFGTSSATAYLESAAGVKAGGRTGMTSVVTALCFIPCLFIAPMVQIIPSCATAPVLILLGGLMFQNVARLDLKHIENWLPAFLTLILIPLTTSITQGVMWGFISHTGIHCLGGRRREISPTLAVITAVCLALVLISNVNWR